MRCRPRARVVFLLVLLALGCGRAPAPAPVSPSWAMPQRYRVSMTVSAAGCARHDLPVEVELDAEKLLESAGASGRFAPASLRVVEVNVSGETLDANVPSQFDADVHPGLVFLLNGKTGSSVTRRFHLYFDTAGTSPPEGHPQLVKLTDPVEHEGQPSYRIETPGGTYLYHKLGAGFASLFDTDGHDWLRYRPTGGSAGNYRGIPNLVHPEGYFHPGGLKCTSRVVSRGPLRLRIASEAEEGKWACTWDIFPAFARLTVRSAPRPYWFLYEGTPGGKLDEADDYYVLSTGEKFAAQTRWDRDIPGPEWIYFGDGKLRRVLYLVHHEDDEHIDAYWPMEGNMTVFGFGRQKLQKFLTKAPARFTVGLCEETEYAKVKAVIEGVSRPPEVKLGPAETKEGPRGQP